MCRERPMSATAHYSHSSSGAMMVAGRRQCTVGATSATTTSAAAVVVVVEEMMVGAMARSSLTLPLVLQPVSLPLIGAQMLVATCAAQLLPQPAKWPTPQTWQRLLCILFQLLLLLTFHRSRPLEVIAVQGDC